MVLVMSARLLRNKIKAGITATTTSTVTTTARADGDTDMCTFLHVVLQYMVFIVANTTRCRCVRVMLAAAGGSTQLLGWY